MKLAIKLPLAFAAALLLMFAGAIYGIVSLNGRSPNTTPRSRRAWPTSAR